jgi:pyruvate kinase
LREGKEEETMLRKTRIICTVGRIDDDWLKNHGIRNIDEAVKKFINAGMDVARINMAHYDLKKGTDRKYLEDLIATIRRVAGNLDKTVAILGDIQGPKVRIKKFLGKVHRVDKNKIRLEVNQQFILTSQPKIASNEQGALIKYEGDFSFFKDIKATVRKDDKGNPRHIEFWFGDGRVILETSLSNISDASAICQVKVPGELKENQGISTKNATIRPGIYDLANYRKDRKDIEFLLQHDIDLLALSFVNCAKDVDNIQTHVNLKIKEKGLLGVKERFYGMKRFPVISKIETEDGLINLGEILEISYGIMVARGDLALRTQIQTIGIYQKEIIGECVTEGKPVITATQMLLSMMDFLEPKRPEATDVTNAIFDGTDALMLSEETADPDSKYPLESIGMMAAISGATEKRIKDLNSIEYKYKVDQQHDKVLINLMREKSELEEAYKRRRMTDIQYQSKKIEFEEAENREHICYDACKTAFGLGCKAIIVLTDTGGTARMISRFKPDMPIVVGVYEDRIARILKISYGVEVFRITGKGREFPFEHFQEVIGHAKAAGLVEDGDRVILVAGYPRGEPGTTSLLNIYKV